MSKFKSIKIKGNKGGFGGPVTVVPDEKKNKIMYMNLEGDRSEVVQRIIELSGMEAINGFNEIVKEDELALVIIDCGGTLRAGVYPRKGIPTVNLIPTGKMGIFAEFMTDDIYVSGTTKDDIELV